MSLKYPHPRATSTPTGKELWDSAARWTSKVDDTSLDTLVSDNFSSVLAGIRAYGKVKNPSVRGAYLEFCVYDLLCRVVENEGLSPSEAIKTDIDLAEGHHAEADMLVNDRLAVLVKVSFRERWKQVDRDVLVMTSTGRRSNHRDFRAWSLFNSEHDEDNDVQSGKKAAIVQNQCYSGVSVTSIKDAKRMAEFIGDVRWAAKDKV